MKNQYATFAAGNAKLSISFVKSKSDFRVRFKTKASDGKESEGVPQYFDPTPEGEKEAKAAFDKLVKGAEAKNWKQVAVTARGKERMSEIPAPGDVKAGKEEKKSK